MTDVKMTLACQSYDRTRALENGEVKVGGVDLTYLSLPVEETFFRMLRFAEFDAAELSLSSYVLTLERGSPFVAIPVFPSRVFRQSAIYVRSDSTLTNPAELRGKRIGVPEYQITAAVWIRGILHDEYGLEPNAVSYRTGGLDQPGRTEKIALTLPPDTEVTAIGPDETLSQMLLDGEIDALYSARNPGPFTSAKGGVRRLFTDFATVERDYAARTRIFPIMHTLVLRRSLYEAHPRLARELYTACVRAKSVAQQGLAETASLRYMLPWLPRHVEETREILGDDWWPYGLEQNLHTLETFLGYHHRQGLAPRLYEPEELFAPETLEEHVV